MNTLTVYGVHRETGEYRIIFGLLADTPQAIQRAKESANRHGYDIARIERHTHWNKLPTDATAEFIKK